MRSMKATPLILTYLILLGTFGTQECLGMKKHSIDRLQQLVKKKTYTTFSKIFQLTKFCKTSVIEYVSDNYSVYGNSKTGIKLYQITDRGITHSIMIDPYGKEMLSQHMFVLDNPDFYKNLLMFTVKSLEDKYKKISELEHVGDFTLTEKVDNEGNKHIKLVLHEHNKSIDTLQRPNPDVNDVQDDNRTVEQLLDLINSK